MSRKRYILLGAACSHLLGGVLEVLRSQSVEPSDDEDEVALQARSSALTESYVVASVRQMVGVRRKSVLKLKKQTDQI